MFLTGWRKWLDNLARSAGRRRTRRLPRPYAPRLEPLEVRWVPSITSATGQNLTPAEGDGSPVLVATFQDTTPSQPQDYSATIDWGDGTVTAGTVSESGGTFSVSGSHAYADETAPGATLPVTVTVQETADDMDSATIAGSAAVTEADTLTGTATPVSTTEGTLFSGAVATFGDTNAAAPASDFTATIDWGDGTTDTGNVTGPVGGPFTVTGAHTYTEDGTQTTTVTLTDDAPGTASASAAGTADVAEASLTVTGTSVSATEGATFSGQVATFTDGNTSAPSTDFTATIAWGDGTTDAGTVTGSSGTFTVTGAHAYGEEGTFTASVAVTDDAGSATPSTSSATAAVSAADAPLTAQGTSFAPAQATTFSGAVASFTDADPNGTATDYTATIDWGDGTTTTGTVSGDEQTGFQVNGQHAYSQAGTFNVQVAIQDAGGSSATAASTATVGSASFSLTPVPVQATEGASMGGAVVATFTHGAGAEPAGQFSVTITWGDGSASAGTVTQGGDGTYTVSGSHTYADEALPLDATLPGFVSGTRAFPITVAVNGASSAASGLTFGMVLEPPLPAGAADVAAFGPRGTPVDRFASELFTTLHGSPIDAATLDSWSSTVNQHGRRQLVQKVLTAGVLNALHQRAVQAGGGSSPLALIRGYYRILLGRDLDPTQPVPALAHANSPNFERDLVRVILTSDEFFG
ncbi:MAG TPA: hypothetical protein VJ739_00420, partial [Gemmataceae bacterium]|nr:hypothetical protein [Gemmataceae bacterium]